MLFEEIFGFESQVAAAVRKTPTLEMDDPLYIYQSRSGAADAICKRLQNESLISEILGPRAQVPSPVPPAFELDFRKCLETGITRAAGIAKRAPERRHKIRQIIDRARSMAPARIHNSGGWDRLAAACESFCTAALLEA